MPRLNKADWQLIREALNFALEDRASYRDAWAGLADSEAKKVRADCDDFKKRAEAFSQKHFSKPTDYKIRNDEFDAMPLVSINDVMRSSRS